jgi:AcrR family transcriptional regulator
VTTPRQHTIVRESAILEAAHGRFMRFGLNKVTMEEIAADVGLGKASLYYYFATKEDIFRSVVEREAKTYLASLRDILQERRAPGEKLKKFLRQRLDLFRTFLRLWHFKADAWTTKRPAFQELFLAMEKEEVKFLSRLLKEGAQQGVFSLRDPLKVARLLLHVLHGLRLRVVRISQTPDESAAHFAALDEEVDQLLDLLFTGMLSKKH